MKLILDTIKNIAPSDIEFLVYIRDKIIQRDGYSQAMPLERIINILEELKQEAKKY